MRSRQGAKRVGWSAEISYWILILLGLGLVLSAAQTMAESWWPGHNGVVAGLDAAAFVVGLTILIVRRQRRNDKPHSATRAIGVAAVAAFGPLVVVLAYVGILHALRS